MRLTTLTTLVVLFIAAVTVATTIPKLWLVARRESRSSREAIADTVAAELARIDVENASAVHALVQRLSRSYPILAVSIDAPAEKDVANTRVRRVGAHLATIYFNSDGRLAGATRTALVAAAGAAVAALILGAVSFFEVLAFLRDSRTRRAMPTDENRHLIQTMQSSIHVMKGREQELRRMHERVQERVDELATITATLVRSLTSGFIALDEEGRIVDMNQAARDLLRYAGPAAGVAPRETLGARRFAAVLQDAVDRRAAVQRTEIEEEDGTIIGLTTVPLLDDSGRHFGMLALFLDLTPLRQLENRLRQMQSLADLGEMSAGIAHEFRNSLSTILGYLRLARKATPTQAIDQSIARAEAEARELATAVDSLLSFTRPLALQPQKVDLTALVTSIADRLRGLNDRVSLSIEGETVVVAADAALLSRAFENLIRNAFDAVAETRDRARIDIRVDGHPTPSVTIVDNGSGIATEQAARLFVPFHSTKPSGFGLGLAMSRKIVLLHGGVVTLESGAGGGAVATVRLPVAEPPEESPEPLVRYFS